MKPSSLKPGDRALCADSRHVYTFLHRDRAECGRPAQCWFDNELIGRVCASDADVIRRWHRLEESRPRG
jgi:hypothetical protein